MSGGAVIVIVLGAIAIARAKFGDDNYDRVVGSILKWWIGGSFVIIFTLIALNKMFGFTLFG